MLLIQKRAEKGDLQVAYEQKISVGNTCQDSLYKQDCLDKTEHT